MNTQATSVRTARQEFEDLVRGAPEFLGEDFMLPSDDQYQEVLNQIKEHKYYTNEKIPFEISMRDAFYSWYELVYEPLMMVIDREGILSAFPGRSRGELFLWISRHWHYLKQEKKSEVSVEEAVRSFGASFGQGRLNRLLFKLKLAAA